jgi:hypothetical protein
VKSFLAAVLLAGLASAGCGFEDSGATGAAGSGAAGSGAAGTGAAGVGAQAGVNGGAGTGMAGTGSDGGAGTGVDAAVNLMPTLLSETGLYSNVATQTLGPNVHPFQPTYFLWSDSATKKRWVYMPPGKKIDTSNMNNWIYPVGFKLFKEFTRGAVKVETRLLMKVTEADWYMMAYKWNADGKDAVAVPSGEANALNTMHDIPSKENCTTCHGINAMYDTALGFSALQLSHDVTDAAELNLAKIKAMDWLTVPPATDKFVLPGSKVESDALGYLHANCGNCHNDYSKVYQTSADLDLWTHVDKPDQLASFQKTFGYLSMVCDQWPGPLGKASKVDPITACGAGHATGAHIEGSISKVTKRIVPKMPAMSAIHELMNLRGDANSKSQMPPIGSEIIDPMGLAGLDAWINSLPLN